MFNVSMRSSDEDNLKDAEDQLREGERQKDKKVVDENVAAYADPEPPVRGSELIKALSMMRSNDKEPFEVEGLFRGLKKWDGGNMDRLLGDDDEGFDVLKR